MNYLTSPLLPDPLLRTARAWGARAVVTFRGIAHRVSTKTASMTAEDTTTICVGTDLHEFLACAKLETDADSYDEVLRQELGLSHE